MVSTFTREIFRKLIHLSSLWICVLYYYVTKEQMIYTTICIAFLYITLDYSRKKFTHLRYSFANLFYFVLRPSEKDNTALTGASYFLMGCLFTIILFDKITSILSIAVLIIADSAAALIGKKYGKHAFFNKTLEGSIAFFCFGFITLCCVGYLFDQKLHFYIMGLISIIVATIGEAFSNKLKIDDNILIPLIVGSVYYAMNYLAHHLA